MLKPTDPSRPRLAGSVAGPGDANSPNDDPVLDSAVEFVLDSKIFGRSEQLKRLLRYLRDAARANDASLLSETAIGVNVFHRKEFNPKIDNIVRSDMLRLRRKLEELYLGEGREERLRVALDKSSYRLLVLPNSRPPDEELSVVASPRFQRRPFWLGVAAGLGAACLVLFIVLVVRSRIRTDSVATAAVNHPIWSGFHSATVEVLEGTPLFFRHSKGYERNWFLNLSGDIPGAKAGLANWPATPAWDRWAAFEDLGTTVHLDRFLRALDSNMTVVGARERSVGGLKAQHTIILGAPKFAPLLIELLADQNFRLASANQGHASLSGFMNVAPAVGERGRYSLTDGSDAESDPRELFIQRIDESTPDYGLISSIRFKEGGEVLSVFGDRPETSSLLIRGLTEGPLFRELSDRVFTSAHRNYQSAQIVVRVDYSKGRPTGLVYLTHRIRD